MADKVGDAFVEISADNRKLKTGLKESARATKKFAAFGARTTSGMTHGVAKMRTAIGLFKFALVGLGIKKLTTDFLEQERAERKVAAALALTGANVSALMPKMKAFASARQRMVAIGDETILQSMALATNLGVQADQLELATDAAIGLASAYDMDLKTAMMLIGRASKGQTQMVARYGIALDTTQSKQEQFNQLLDIGSKKFALAAADAKTFAGTAKLAGADLGDLGESIGGIVIHLFDVQGAMRGTGESAQSLAGRINELTDAGVWIRWSETIKATMQAVWLSLKTPFILLGGLINEIMSGNFKNLGKAMEEAWKGIGIQQDQIFSDMGKNVQKRLKDLEFEKGAQAGVNDELADGNEKMKERLQMGSSFADVLKFAQQAALAGGKAGGAAGGGGGNPAGAGGGNGGGAAGGGNGIFAMMLQELKLQTKALEAMAVFG